MLSETRVATVRVKGTKLSSKLTYVKETYGDEALSRVLDALPPEDRKQLHLVLDLAWYPFDLYQRLLQSIVTSAAGGDAAVLERIGEHTADLQAKGAYRVFFRSGDPATVLERMAPMHSLLNDPGEMEVVRTGPRQASIVVRQPPSTQELCRVARAFYRRSLELAGAREVMVREPECSARGGACCRFELRW